MPTAVVRLCQVNPGPFDKKSLTFVSSVPNYVDMGQPAALIFTVDTPFSIALWAKTSSMDYASLVSKLDSASPYTGYELLMLGAGEASRVRLQLFDNAGHLIAFDSVENAINDGEWHLVVATYDGSGSDSGMHIYVDGELADAGGSTDPHTGPITNNIPFQLGMRGGSNVPNQIPFDGLMDEVSIWNRALSATNVSQIYNGGQPADISPIPGLIAWWRMEPAAGDSIEQELIVDQAGASSGTPVGFPDNDSFTTDVP